MIKQRYKSKALRKILDSERYSPKDLIQKSIQDLEKEKIIKCIEKGLS
jgi:hypothetical protein